MLNKLGQFIVYSNLYVALATACLVKTTEYLLGIREWKVAALVFLATFFGYNYMRMHQQMDRPAGKMTALHRWMNKYKVLLYILANLAGLAGVGVLFFLNRALVWWLIPLAVISLLYPVKLFRVQGRLLRLRELPGIKILLIAFVWSLATVILPVVHAAYPFDMDVYLLIVERFLFVIAITIPFDIRDVNFDDKHLQTLPQLLGIDRAKWLALVALLIFELLLILQFFYGEVLRLPYLFALLLSAELSGLVVFFSHEKRSNAYFTVLVEGMSIGMFILVWLAGFL